MRPSLALASALLSGLAVLLLGPRCASAVSALLPAALAGDHRVVETLFMLLVYGALAACALVGARLFGRSAWQVGDKPLCCIALGLFAGVTGLIAAVAVSAAAGTLVPGGSPGISLVPLLWGLSLVAVQAGSEELFFRGWVQPVLAERFGTALAVLVTALLFAGLHLAGGVRSPLSLLNLLLGGVMFGLAAAHGRGIAGAFGLHFGWNATEQLLFGLQPNPGTGGFGALLDLDLAGPGWLGGSAEGLNASLAMSLALIALIVPQAIAARRMLAGGSDDAPALWRRRTVLR
ncbi:CPBP family intramembrane glutamic endopeptidase [Sphingomonas sanxanigenens]|uniref:CAAX prenyl protease 2/Lysostaphin resistance protein A-like domain-containing protein n=1 Tax=Sphingomonas sanxanigenens DSM 19645 = NX02 TaxID=1123269 RepID=W0AMW0_9SPHN|nr:CPBP family intramembrane glutamic endopeptidase [Sphingomonas sanxanigenens]AHE57015.1 hypothetical protein NX02_27145 [Sphingomonas sanxanigenens DSM 19645 = NX02]